MDSTAEGSEKITEAKEEKKEEKSYAHVMPFSALCQFFEKCSQLSKTTSKKALLTKFLKLYVDDDIFPLIRLIAPQLDRERGAYGLKESALAKAYISIFALHPNSEVAQRLINYRTPSAGNIEVVGDFGASVYDFLQRRSGPHSKCSIAKVNHYLDLLQGEPERKKKYEILKKIIRKTSPLEQKWLVRLILKNMNIGMSINSVLDTLHPNAVEAYALSSNLAKVCQEIRNPHRSLQNILHLFSPIKPMLADRKRPQDIVRLIAKDRYALEPKYDGERIHLHKDGGTYKLFSRNANDVTDLYLSHLMPNLHLITAASCILDGELLVWDSEVESFEPFGGIKTVAKRTFRGSSSLSLHPDLALEGPGKNLCYLVFDILFANGMDVLTLSYEKRKELLHQLIPVQTPHALEVVAHAEVKKKDDILNALDEAIVNGDEGIMLKSLASPYVPDERKEKWIKIKPEYVEGLYDTLDFLVLGGYFGRGNQSDGRGYRAGIISHFLLGIKAPESANQKEPHYWSICKVASGATRGDLHQLNAYFAPHWRPFVVSRPPPHFELANKTYEKPDVWIPPNKSMVLQVKCAQLNPSSRYKAGYTTRFPRLQNGRPYKSPDDILDYAQLLDLISRPKGTSSSGKAADAIGFEEDGGGSPVRKRRKTTRNFDTSSSLAMVLPHYQSADVTAVEVEDSLFGGLELLVLSGDGTHNKQQLEILIHQHGGHCVQSARDATRYVISGSHSVRMHNIIAHGTHDVLYPQWVLDSIEQKRTMKLSPKYVVFLTDSSRRKLEDQMDRFGDSYVEDCDYTSLRKTMDLIPLSYPVPEESSQSSANLPSTVPRLPFDTAISILCSKRHRELEESLFMDEKPLWLFFRRYVFYLDVFLEIGNEETRIQYSRLDLTAQLIRFYGGIVTSQLNEDVTHVLLDHRDTSRLLEIRNRCSQLYRLPSHMARHVCAAEWVSDCVKQKSFLEERDYYF